jgi:hypothetical protein
MKRIGAALYPADAKAASLVRKLPDRTPVPVRVMRGRSAQQAALYWSVLEHVVDATGRWSTPEELHNALKVATGHIDIVRLIDGRMVKIPQSTAFDAMSQDEAQHYYDAAFRIIAEDIGLSIEDLLANTIERAA